VARAWLVCAALVVVTDALQLPCAVGRRALILGAASSVCTLGALPSTALSADELSGVIQRAQSEGLKTDGVISRAARNDLVDPKLLINDCKALERLSTVDADAAEQVRYGNQAMERRLKAQGGSEKADKELSAGRNIEKRIRNRQLQFTDAYNVVCVPPS